MRRITVLVVVLLVVLGLTAAVAVAQGQGHGPPSHSQAPHAPEPEAAQVVVLTGDVEDHGQASPPFAAAEPIDTVDLGEGSWKISATGAANLDGDGTAFNCGLRVVDFMIAKQNPAVGGEEGRVGFAVTGAYTVEAGEEVTVELVCYGGDSSVGAEEPYDGGNVFEHNLVAVGG